MNTIGNNIKITFFGESHGPYIGLVIDNLPAGLQIDEDLIKSNLTKRRPKKNISTPRIEADNYQIISGFYNGFTTGGAFTVIIENSNTKSKDYKNLNNTPRPSHSDYPASIKYKGYNDYRGGGFFSGRITALWMVVGAISEQILKKHNVYIGSHIYSLKNIEDDSFNLNLEEKEQLVKLNNEAFPVINAEKETKMRELIEDAKNNSDAVGGIVETKAINLPVGLGEPYFLSVESYLSNLLFSVPGVKGVEFGEGFNLTKLFSSEVKDEYIIKNDRITTKNNNNGGILGGLTTGRPLIVKCAIKPTSSIAKTQQTIDLKKCIETQLNVEGRHDPQIVSRAAHVINSVIYFGILDLLIFNFKKDSII
ncbi:MAG: chorismate synthase [Tenericutes bacterium]|nr:chorismate synthase [Mycoplasmatota bacterium]